MAFSVRHGVRHKDLARGLVRTRKSCRLRKKSVPPLSKVRRDQGENSILAAKIYILRLAMYILALAIYNAGAAIEISPIGKASFHAGVIKFLKASRRLLSLLSAPGRNMSSGLPRQAGRRARPRASGSAVVC